MDINILREAVTVVSFVAFLCIVAYAAAPANEKRFRDAANHPLRDDEPAVPGQEGR
jgi:cbb3-type cytochrome oxidase subunit 3